MSQQITGTVHEISATQQVTDSLKKRELILEYAENPQYPEYIKFEAIQDRCALLDQLKPGVTATVHFNLKGRPWTDKTGKKSYFNSLQLWKVEAQGNYQPTFAPEKNSVDSSAAPDDDDLPF